MKMISWNVNGIRAIERKGFADIFRKINADIFCLQEVKAQESDYPNSLKFEDYHLYTHLADKKGYSGVAVYTKVKPQNVIRGVGIENEGRVLILEFDDFFLFNIYFPNAQPGLTRLDFRMKFNDKILEHSEELRKKKPIIMCGDFNVAHTEIDLKNAKANIGEHGFTKEERDWFSKLLSFGYIDTFRHFNKEPNNYTWWSYMFKARERNTGWRIDYFVISNELIGRLLDAKIHSDVYGSDHCPVEINME